MKELVINEQKRKTLGIDRIEYIFCLFVYSMCREGVPLVPGWCVCTPLEKAIFMEMSVLKVRVLQKSLIKKGIIIKDTFSQYIKLFPEWDECD